MNGLLCLICYSSPLCVGNRIIKKRIHVRLEHLQPSRRNEEFLHRKLNNDKLKAEAKIIITTYWELDRNNYLDPRTAQVATVDHVKDLYENACRLKGGAASALPLVHLFVNSILLVLLLFEARCYPHSQGALLSRMSGGVSSVVVLKATDLTTAVYDIDHKLSG